MGNNHERNQQGVVKRIEKDHRVSDVDFIFQMMDKGMTMVQANEQLERKHQKGEHYQQLAIEALGKSPSVGIVKQASKYMDYTHGVDAEVILKTGEKVIVQIKTTVKQVKKFYENAGSEDSKCDPVKAERLLAGKNVMALAAGEKDTDEKNRQSVMNQFEGWVQKYKR